MEGNHEGSGAERLFQGQAFPSWRGGGAFGVGGQSEAALAACAPGPKADVGRDDGKAVRCEGMLETGGGHGR